MSIGSTTAESGAARFSRQVAWTLGARLVIAGSSLLGGIIVARWLGAASVGILASLGVISLLTLTFGGAGLPSAITYLVARDRQRMKAVMINGVIFALAAGGILALGIIVLLHLKPGVFGDVPTQLATIAAAAIPFQLLTLFCLSAILGLGNIGRYNLFDMLSQAFLSINPFVILILLEIGLPALVSANAVTAVLLGLFILWILLRSTSGQQPNNRIRLDGALLAEMLRYGSKFYIAMIAAVIILRADLLIVNYFRGASEVGVYAVAAQVGTMLMLIPGVISTVLFPRVTAAQDASADMTCRVTRHTALIMFVVCLAVIPLAFLLPSLYGQAFADVPFLVLILLPGVYLFAIESVLVQYFSSLGLPRAIPIFWLGTLAINLTLDLIFVPFFGAYAAAAVSSISYTLMFILVAVYFQTQTGKSFAESFVLRNGEFRGLLKLYKNAANAETG